MRAAPKPHFGPQQIHFQVSQMRACVRFGVLPVAQYQHAQDWLLLAGSLPASTCSVDVLAALITVATPAGGVFATVLGGAALLSLGFPGGLPFLDEGIGHLQGVPEACIATVGQDVYLEMV